MSIRIDFEQLFEIGKLKRFDLRLLQNKNNCIFGKPGLQKVLRNWFKYYIFDGVLENNIHMNSKNINNANNIDINGILDVLGQTNIHSDVDLNTNDLLNIGLFEFNDESKPTSFDTSKIFLFPENNILYAVINNKKYFIGHKKLGFFGGGTGVTDLIEYINITTITGDAIDRGDLTVARSLLAGINGSTYGFFGGGNTGSYSDVIDYIDLNTNVGDASDKGDLTVARDGLGGINGDTYGFFGGGDDGSQSDVIDYIDITTTTGDAIDRGNLSVAREGVAGVSGPTYGFYGGGNDGSESDVIDYIDHSVISGNASDKGDLTIARSYLAGVYGLTYGFFCGGQDGANLDVIDYIDITTTSGNATDRGDLSPAGFNIAGISGNVYGFVGPGSGFDSGRNDHISFIDITTSAAGDSADKGDPTIARTSEGGVF